MADPGEVISEFSVQEDPLRRYFCPFARADGQMDADELQRCLKSSGIVGNYQFSKQTCFLMIMMLDRDYSGKIGFDEFKELWSALNQWKITFTIFDIDGSGTINGHQLEQIIISFGFRLSRRTLIVIHSRNSIASQIALDDFVRICVRLRLITFQFKRRAFLNKGRAVFTLDDFVEFMMSS